MRVDVWSDVMCPWCAIGRAHLEAAIAAFGENHDEPVEVRWRSFELDPYAPRLVEGDYLAKLAEKYGVPLVQAQQMVFQMMERGKASGVGFDFDRIRPGNTFDAHRLLHLALEDGGPALQGALKGRLFQAYFREGEAVGQPDVLARLAADVGLDPERIREVLASDRFADRVRAEEMLAQRLGVRGVPFYVLDERISVSGAQPVELLVRALEHALETHARPDEGLDADDGESCGPDGCEVPGSSPG